MESCCQKSDKKSHRSPAITSPGIISRLLLCLLAVYRTVISPLVGQCCRFYPSCSEYAQQAILTHGVLRGAWLTAKRLAKCHPWHEGGLDPVPETKSTKD